MELEMHIIQVKVRRDKVDISDDIPIKIHKM